MLRLCGSTGMLKKHCFFFKVLIHNISDKVVFNFLCWLCLTRLKIISWTFTATSYNNNEFILDLNSSLIFMLVMWRKVCVNFVYVTPHWVFMLPILKRLNCSQPQHLLLKDPANLKFPPGNDEKKSDLWNKTLGSKACKTPLKFLTVKLLWHVRIL